MTLFLAAGALVASAAVFAGALKPSEVCRDGGCYLVTTSVTGYTVDRDGDTVTITPKTGSVSGAAVPIGRVVQRITELGKQVSQDGKRAFDYPTGSAWLKKYLNPNVIDLSTFPAATGQYAGMDRQPFLTNGPERRGSLHQAATINLAQRLTDKGEVLAGNQLDYLRTLDGKAVPGTLYVTLFVRPDEAGEKWQVSRWNYLYEPNLDLALERMPPARCPDGQEGIPPDCSADPDDPGDIAPPAPPAEPDCPQGYIRDDRGWCRVPPEGYLGPVDPGLRFRLSE